MLPSRKRWPPADGPSRLLHIRILLLRTFFSPPSRPPEPQLQYSVPSLDSQLTDSITTHCLVTCAKTAQQIIELISSNLEIQGSPSVLPSPWYNICYVYTAATVLIAAHIFPAIVEVVPRPTLARTLDQAFDCLRHYEGLVKSARRCRSALEVLYEKVTLPRGAALPQEDFASEFAHSNTARHEPVGIAMPSDMEQEPGLSPLLEGMDMFWRDCLLFDQNYEPWQ